MLSKSRYLKGLKCNKALWLYQHKREEAYYPESTRAVFSQGNTSGELAQQYFPNGELALVDNYPNSKAVTKTQELILKGITTIYEATFIFNNTLVAVDILHKEKDKWFAFEVKSTNSIKTTHILDAAIQYYVITGNGIDLEDISIMHFNRDYIRLGEINPKELFKYQSVKNNIHEYLVEIPKNIGSFIKLLKNSEEPNILQSPHCNEPYGCEFYNYCAKLPENEEYNLPEEIIHLAKEPNHINYDAINEFLKQVTYPIYSFDFETVMYGIPEFNYSRPYQQIPFQYSIHKINSLNSSPIHKEYLGDGVNDPREELIIQMIMDLEDEGDILVYNISFERTRIKELARDFPEYEIQLTKIQNRLVDLLPVFRYHYKAPATEKSASLKIVLPTFVPKLSYLNNDIQNGMQTMDAYKNLKNISDKKELDSIRNAMVEYCKLDTLAVLKLFQKLNNINN